jgi:hypothetical protein
MAHALAAHPSPGDFYATLFADNALEADLLILTAVALPILGRAEDLLAEKTVALGFEGSIVNGFGFLNLPVGPSSDPLWGDYSDSKFLEILDFRHLLNHIP